MMSVSDLLAAGGGTSSSAEEHDVMIIVPHNIAASIHRRCFFILQVIKYPVPLTANRAAKVQLFPQSGNTFPKKQQKTPTELHINNIYANLSKSKRACQNTIKVGSIN